MCQFYSDVTAKCIESEGKSIIFGYVECQPNSDVIIVTYYPPIIEDPQLSDWISGFS